MANRWRWLSISAISAAAAVIVSPHAAAYTSQVDGTPLPQSGNLQSCLDRATTGEGVANAVNAIQEAAILPEAFRPVEDPPGSGSYPVTFMAIGEGAGFRNTFGYYWTDTDVTNPVNLRMVFECRPTTGTPGYGGVYDGGQCGCPCDPDEMRPDDGTPYAWRRTIDFATVPDFAPGRALGMWIRSPERFAGGDNTAHCDVGGPAAGNQDHRTYFTSQALNDDGDYVHFLVYRSAEHDNTFYFGFEDLFRGGDNDFEDVLVRATGLVPLCDPQPETCNAEDDDCDLAVDEGLTQACMTSCGSGVRECTAGSFGDCSAPEATTETCNAVDDDCDTTVDEGLSRACMNDCGSGTEVCEMGSYVDCNAPTPTIENCDNVDDDCDGLVDEMITEACFTDCGSGTRTCSAGSFGPCSAASPAAMETCNALDDDCDGLTDEDLTRPCSSECGSGTETCISGDWVGCNAPAPTIEVCNNNDDDCDDAIDEMLSRTCSTACGPGLENCEAGDWVDCSAPDPTDEICNNLDDDCDGVIDDGNPGGGESCVPVVDGDDDEYIIVDPEPVDDMCIPGIVSCVAGDLLCLGATSPGREICNCEDDDCDGVIDESTSDSICPGGACISCNCASPCMPGEFPCPPGRVCDTTMADPPDIPGYCVPGLCTDVVCSDEETCNPLTGECDDLCTFVACADTHVCIRGTCVENNCYGLGCEVGQRCQEGTCQGDPCFGVTCESDEFCREGTCVSPCPGCDEGEICQDSVCIDDPCDGRCRDMEVCVDGECVVDSCVPPCGRNRVCVDSMCVDDPCASIDCPTNTICLGGECVTEVPRARPIQVLATGGGGCTCDTTKTPTSTYGLAFLVGLFLLTRRRNWSQAIRRAGGMLMIVATAGATTMSSGCDVDPFCIANCGNENADAGTPVDSGEGRIGTVDGCVPSGEERCNDTDDDCDGRIDETFDLQRDPANCGTCGHECILPQAFPTCELGECEIDQCEIGFVDLNEVPFDGCEYECLNSGGELCDERDNDCNGVEDEGFDLDDDLGNCGECGNLCTFANAMSECDSGECEMIGCNPGFLDINDDPADGCEYACEIIGTDLCNGVDDDCDLTIDEGYDTTDDILNCGVCGIICGYPRSAPSCIDGICQLGACEPNYYDIDGDPLTGCEYPCTFASANDTCNMMDDDCDGSVDEDEPMVGTACGPSAGFCEQGSWACVTGMLRCIGGIGPTPETCNGTDDDCDGNTDENTVASPLPSVGQRCGETNVGPCEYGSIVCSGGALSCAGGYVPPATESCNGIDDDCDGTADDSPTGPAMTPPGCVETRGVCGGRTPECFGAGGYDCTLPDTYQATETICDGLNNDCDNNTDEGCLEVAGAGDTRLDSGDTAGANNSVQATIAGDGASHLYTAFMDLRVSDAARIFFTRSTDGGASWEADARVDSNSGATIGPRIGVTSGPGATTDVATLWSDFRGGTSYREIYNRFSTDSLDNFSAAENRLNTGQNLDSFGIEIAVAGTNLYAVYETFTSSRSRHLFFMRSTNGGSSWANDDAPIQIDHGLGTDFVASTPRLAAVGTNVYAVWRDNRNGGFDVFFNRSTDSGATWLADDVRLDLGTAAGDSASFSPSIAAEGTNIYVVWVDDRSGDSFDIYMNRSTNSGASWLASAVELDDDPLPHDSIEPEVATTGSGTAVVAWIDYRNGFSDILAVRLSAAGATVGDPERVDTGSNSGVATSQHLDLSASGSLTVAVWSDDRGGFFDVYANFSLDGGVTWQPDDYRLDSTTSNNDSLFPSVFVTSTAAHFVWQDLRNSAAAGNADIFYRRMD